MTATDRRHFDYLSFDEFHSSSGRKHSRFAHAMVLTHGEMMLGEIYRHCDAQYTTLKDLHRSNDALPLDVQTALPFDEMQILCKSRLGLYAFLLLVRSA